MTNYYNLQKPYLIAEISANHQGKLSNALKLIRIAKSNGADAVKLQTYQPSEITVNVKNKFFKIKSGLWKNYYLWDLYNIGQTPLSWHKELFQYAKKIGITIFSTPFDEKSVDFLEKLKCPFYKISSFEVTHIPLIQKVASTKKNLIISTGMASMNELKNSYKTAKKFGAKKITFLYCVSNYPSKPEDFYLNNLIELKKNFNCNIGLSDHSNSLSASSLSVKLGATVFEKHIALDKDKSLDGKFSLVGEEIKEYKQNLVDCFNISKNLSIKKFYVAKKEKANKIYRRSIFSTEKILKGDSFSVKNIKVVRPSNGQSPSDFNYFLGKKSRSIIPKGYPLFKKYVKKK
jgi:pseudaminic acid synthase